MMDALAEKLGMDPVELRLKNFATVSQEREGRPYTSTGFARCLREGAAAFGWKEARARPRDTGRLRRGVGVAGAMWGYDGDPRTTALVKLAADGSATLVTGASDIGTGTKTILAMVVAEELGSPSTASGRARRHPDHAVRPGSGGSQTALVNAPAVRAAAADVKRQLLAIAAGETKRPAERLLLRDGKVVDTSDRSWAIGLGDLKGLRERENLLGVGRRQPHPEGKVALPFAAHFAEVEVDTLTGEVRVLRLLGAHDSGRVLNPLTYRNQVFGGMTMGIGFGLTERRTLDPQTGKMVNANWHNRDPDRSRRPRGAGLPPHRPPGPRVRRHRGQGPSAGLRHHPHRGRNRQRRLPRDRDPDDAGSDHAHGDAPAARRAPREGMSHASAIRYARPTSLAEAVRLLAEPDAHVLAGGTDLVGCLRDRTFTARTLVALSGLPELLGIRELPDGSLRIGPRTTLADVASHPEIVRRFSALAEGAAAAASPQSHQGTIGGNLCQRPRCWYYRGDFHCARKGGDVCYAMQGENEYHAVFGGAGCYIVHPSDTAAPLVARWRRASASSARPGSGRRPSRSSSSSRPMTSRGRTR